MSTRRKIVIRLKDSEDTVTYRGGSDLSWSITEGGDLIVATAQANAAVARGEWTHFYGDAEVTVQ